MAAIFILLLSSIARADTLDDYIQAQMRQRHIAGVSIAIIENGQIVRASGYGEVQKGSGTAVTPATLFQAASISKSVTALGALRLVGQGKLSLDTDINDTLTSWKLPDTQFTQVNKVTLRQILSHTAGLNIHGFPGYDVNDPLPTLLQILNGDKPANNTGVRVDTVPGSAWKYSGGGYMILQQMMIDSGRNPFPQLLQESVLTPLGMTSSTFEQPLPAEKASLTASGYYANGTAVRGRWHVYPELAAAGLWTTPTDLARFAIGIQQAFAGKSTAVISSTMASKMLTVQKSGDGLGVFLEASGASARFTHNGRNEGFDSLMTAYVSTGQGAVIMINANDDSGTLERIMEAISKQYNWPGYPQFLLGGPTIIRQRAR